jgi:hypothetical protein
MTDETSEHYLEFRYQRVVLREVWSGLPITSAMRE